MTIFIHFEKSMLKYLAFFSILFSIQLFSQTIEERKDFQSFFEEENIYGSILLYDLNENRYYAYNAHRVDSSFIPASTFKIFNSLVGIETGIISDTNYIFEWNGEKHWMDNWNQDLSLRKAFQFSCVPCYQELAKKIGDERMQFYIDKEKYGNQNISGGIDMFWLEGDLRISQKQQIELLKDLYLNNLSFSKRTMEIVKEIMLIENDGLHKLRGKTGWGVIEDENYGWFVGYSETNDDVIFFAISIEAPKPRPENFLSARLDITKKILKIISSKN